MSDESPFFPPKPEDASTFKGSGGSIGRRVQTLAYVVTELFKLVREDVADPRRRARMLALEGMLKGVDHGDG